MARNFLTAEWRDLIVLNYRADAATLQSYVPEGTELDLYQGQAYVSIVAFRFLDNKLFGTIPTFPVRSFEEINLRIYIRRQVAGEIRRAVVFVREVVPSHLIAATARLFYNEPYVKMRTAHQKKLSDNRIDLEYSWGATHQVRACATLPYSDLQRGGFEEFILEHYWGYTCQRNGRVIEYQVQHPRWRAAPAESFSISPSVSNFYGKEFEPILSSPPHSVFIVEGSGISVSPGRLLPRCPPLGLVLYDGRCGFCSWWIPYWRPTIQAAGYDILPVQSPGIAEKLAIASEELNQDIRLLLNDGTVINGADAYIYGMKQVWWSRPLGVLLGLPFFRQLTWGFYLIFNRNRFLVSRICNLRADIE